MHRSKTQERHLSHPRHLHSRGLACHCERIRYALCKPCGERSESIREATLAPRLVQCRCLGCNWNRDYFVGKERLLARTLVICLCQATCQAPLPHLNAYGHASILPRLVGQSLDGLRDSPQRLCEDRPGTSDVDALESLALGAKDVTLVQIDSRALHHEPFQLGLG